MPVERQSQVAGLRSQVASKEAIEDMDEMEVIDELEVLDEIEDWQRLRRRRIATWKRSKSEA